jgi:uncharacterized protein YndB with AHSA1/START domain
MPTETQHTQTENRIEKNVLLRVPQSRVWRAIRDPKEFGSWFGMEVDGQFSPGKKVKGRIVPTTVDPEIAKQQRQYEGLSFELAIDRVEPERHFSFHWHPAAVDREVDYAHEPTTLVSFELEKIPDGVILTVTESGFDRLPPERRAEAFASNEEGWAKQMELIKKYVAKS